MNILITLACPQLQNIQIYPRLGQLRVNRALVHEEENVILARISFIKIRENLFLGNIGTVLPRFVFLFSTFFLILVQAGNYSSSSNV